MSLPSKSEIIASMNNSSCYKSPMLIGGMVFKKGGRVTSHAGGFSSVFPFTNVKGEKIAVKCWSSDIGDVKSRMIAISTKIKQLKLPYFIDFLFEEKGLLVIGKVQPIIVMEWCDSLDLKEFINSNINKKVILLELAENFKSMVKAFHFHKIAHGDLSHGNIKVRSDRTLLVIDYDSMFVAYLIGMTDNVKGMPGYQHPKRALNITVNDKLDYFSELIIYLSLLVYSEMPELWVEYYETEDFLFSKLDFNDPQNSSLFQSLLKSLNKTIKYLTNYLIKALLFNDISEIEPLEKVLEDRLSGSVNSIIDKF